MKDEVDLRRTPGQRKSDVVKHARSRLRMEQLRQHSARGSTKEEAAKALGLSVAGVNSILFRHIQATTWPIAP